jgi:hypothetical protein
MGLHPIASVTHGGTFPALYLVSTRHHADEPHDPRVSATVYDHAVAATPPCWTSALLPWDTTPPGHTFCHLARYPAAPHAAPSIQPKQERGQAIYLLLPSQYAHGFFLLVLY